MSGPVPLSRPFPTARLKQGAQSITWSLDEADRAALATWLDLPGIASLTAEMTVSPWRREGALVEGTLDARLTQICVVTLEPFESTLSAPIARRFHPDAEPNTVIEDPEAEDPPEPLTERILDLGVILAEELSLALDPFPKAPGAVLPETAAGEAAQEGEKRPNPFAALAALKSKPEGTGS
ncbi:MAG: DUF177 domain-containing protein [Alphaproteobacteria bacterium]|nr:DUF177 domain-containing protein [Alphaproteobacteria bacterium]